MADQAAQGPLRVLHVVPSFWPAERYGGPIVSVRRLCAALGDRGVLVDVATTNADGPDDLDVPLDGWRPLDSFRVRYFPRWPRIDYAFSPRLARFLQVSISDYHLIHVTSTFSFPAMAAERAALRARRPFVVSPRGSLQSWSLSQKRWKKVPYWFALERRHLRRAARIHVTAELEDEQVRRALPTARTFLVPNGSDFPPVAAVARLPRRLVFLGRLHPKKGFDVLVPALSELARTHPDVETVVAGPDDVGEWPRIEARLAAVSPRPAVRWIGAVGGEAKWELLASARAFVLPSHSENFGQAVVEALACGTPVVVSTNCPWRQIAEKNAGAWIENRPDLLARALRAILDADGAAYAAMQRAALEIAAGFTWPAAAAAMEREYRAVLAEAQEAPR